MSDVLIDDTYLTDIADSIRNKLNVQTRFKPSEMANGIASISGGFGKRFADILTSYDTPINISAIDFKQGTTLKTQAFSHSESTDDKLKQYEDNIESIVFPQSGVISTPTSLTRFFYNNDAIESIYLNGLITLSVTDLSEMFEYCDSLSFVDFGQSDVSNVTTMIAIFNGCTALEHIDLSSLNLSNSPNIGRMFYGCTNLISVIFPSTTKVFNANVSGKIFGNCTSLQSLTILATTPPSGGGNLFNSVNTGMKIFVPSSSVATYKADSTNGWSTYADIIYAIPG